MNKSNNRPSKNHIANEMSKYLAKMLKKQNARPNPTLARRIEKMKSIMNSRGFKFAA